MEDNKILPLKQSIAVLCILATALLIMCIISISKNLPVHSACCGASFGVLLLRTLDYIEKFKT